MSILVNFERAITVGKTVSCSLRFWIAWIPWAAGFSASQAQSPAMARLTLIQPVGARIGSTIEAVAQGTDLEESSGLVFSVPGITATPKEGNRFAIKVASNAPLGVCDVRFVGRFGVSNPRAIEITTNPSWSIPATNISPTAVVSLPLDTIADAHVTANAVDHYGVELKQGQRVIARIVSRELDSKLEPILVFFNAEGRELMRARHSLLDFTAPSDGNYILKVHDALYRGGDDYFYRLSFLTSPYVDFAIPNVLRTGETNRVVLVGRNLPGGTLGSRTGVDRRRLEERTVEIVAPTSADSREVLVRRNGAFIDGFNWSLRDTNGQSNPIRFSLTELPIITAPTSASLTPISIPTEYCGQFQARGGLSGVQFTAKKGEVAWIEVFSNRLGWPTDPSAVVQRLAEAKDPQAAVSWSDVLELPELDSNVGDRDFNTASLDCGGRFESPADATYRVVVRDLYNLGTPNPRYLYRLSVRRETPDYRLVAVPAQPPRPKDDNREIHPVSPVVRRGGTQAIRVMAFRRDGFGGEIELSATGLPKGVRSPSSRILAGQNTGLLFLTADETAAGWSGFIEISGKSRIGNQTVERKSRAGSVVWHLPDWNQASVESRLTTGLPLSVLDTEPTPVQVLVAMEKPLEAPADGKLAIPVRVRRNSDYNAAFNLKALGRPELDKSKDAPVAEKGTNATVELNLAELKLPEGTHWIWLQGQCAGKYRKLPEAAEAATLAAKEADKVATEAAAAAKKATDELAALKNPTPEVKVAAEKRAAELDTKAKAAEDKKKSTAQIAKDSEERAKPRDVVVPVWSTPFPIKIIAAAKPPEKK